LIHSLGGNAETQQAVQLFIEAEGIIEVVSLCILAVLVAPIIEEFIYRGFLYPIIKYHLGRGLALGMTSILFGISHAHWLSILPLTALGVVLALLYDQTGRLGYPILLHSVFNSVTCAVILVELYAG
jgi:membrane protease YdiL (CAAX protease family)